MSILELHNVSCEKQDRELFSDVSLCVRSGELLFLKGENGAGKTSLIRIIVGLSKPIEGTVLLEGEDIHKLPDIRCKLVYCGHKLGLNPNLSALENIQFWLATHNKNKAKSELMAVFENLGLEGLEDLSVKYLSAGQQRKAALAKLWMSQDAKLWILDEPFTALDKQTVVLLSDKVSSFVSSGGSVVMTSHQDISVDCKTQEFTLEYKW